MEIRRSLRFSWRETPVVEAMGGHLALVAEFPDRDPVVLSGIANMDAER